MNNPCKNKSYIAKLLLSIEFDNLEFSSIQNYEFEVPGHFSKDWDELGDEAKRQFVEEHRDMFVDTDMSIVLMTIKKN
jgi:hypothetical protein